MWPGAATDTASGAYVMAYQVGISAGSGLGAVLIDIAGTRTLAVISAAVAAAGTAALVVVARRAWPQP